ncbi:MAG: ImmA/IrrE family metallo-endopeptidase [Thermovirgaceae bacterium]|nr:ImmA/IrrE family metallo-endopeptidase [Thermovirgaceae bacterium]
MAKASKWLDDFNYLEKILHNEMPFRLKDVKKQCSRENPVEAAYLCRKELDLDSEEPIHDICGLLEKAGVKILALSLASEGFFGLSIGKEDGGPAIIVNDREQITVERRIFSAVHELGHLMLHPEAFDVNETVEDNGQERQADHFAGYFLMPDEGFLKEWKGAAGLHWVDRVLKVKGIFRVSYKTVLHRLIERGEADKSIWPKFNVAYNKRYHKGLSFREEPDGVEEGDEPYKLAPFVFFENRFNRLVRDAVEKGKISLSRGAEMLGIPICEMRELIQSWEFVA